VASVYKRAEERAKGKAGKWTADWVNERGKRTREVKFTDRARTLAYANHREMECTLIREGRADPAEPKRKAAANRAAADHAADYRLHLIAKGGGAKHAGHVAGVLVRLLDAAAVGSVADLSPERIEAALGRMKAAGKSARTCNHARGAVRAFARWLAENGRIAAVPPGVASLAVRNEAEDRRRVRRALAPGEVARLLDAAAKGEPVVAAFGRTRSRHHATMISGPERRILYLLAMSTGFRANELRSLTPESFQLEGDSPTVTVKAEYSKRGRLDVQPIRRDVAAELAPWLATREPGRPVLPVPEKTAALLARDLAAAGIAAEKDGGIVDFHSLRHSYITNLYKKTKDPKLVQRLARHSTITLTLDRYCHIEDSDARGALEDE
jgi:integrase/recombinase XerD